MRLNELKKKRMKIMKMTRKKMKSLGKMSMRGGQ